MKRAAVLVGLSMMAFSLPAQDVFQSDGHGCDSRQIRWDGELAHVEAETIDASSLRALKVSVTSAPVAVRGGSPRGYTIEVCKAAATTRDLAEIRVWLDGSELRSEGPEGRRWMVFYSIEAPADGDVDVTAKNGPLSIRDYEGVLRADATNGPLSLNNVRGSVEATTTNGPVSIRGGAGSMKVRATNGPLSIHLEGNSWSGGELDAATKNGPVTLKLPRSYASGVVVETNGRGPVSCNAEGCAGVRRFETDAWSREPRRIDLGSGAEAVRITTANGPLTISND